ncbi:MAG: branched-chain amino acid ABC transporter permease [Hyphomicrobiaceae bacterium]|nr:branched-chain amino acid ABC transporter permease [Hyphomicrobiaceae bacterium]
MRKVGSILLLLGLESVGFAVFVAFMVAEGLGAIMAVLFGVLIASLALGRTKRLSEALRNLFEEHRKLAIAWGGLFVLALPFILHDNPYAVHMLFLAGLFVALAIGLDFQVGSTNLVNFATASTYGIGAYTAALLSVSFGWSFWIVLPLSGLAGMLFGFVLGLPTMKTKTYYLSLVTMAVGLIIYLLLNNLSWTGGPNGIAGIPTPTIGGSDFADGLTVFGIELPFQANFYYLILAVVLVEYIVARRLHMSKVGLAWNAIRDDEIAASCQGIDVTGYKIMAFYTNAFFDGLVGAIYAFSVGFISPENFAFMLSVIVIAMVLVGGMGNTAGVVVGAVLLTLIPEKLQVVEAYRLWLFAIIMLVMLLARPRGLFPQLVRQYR